MAGLLFTAILFLAAVGSYPGATVVGVLAGVRTTAAAATPPGWLHVQREAGGLPYIADSQGRRLILRGATAAGLLDYWSGVDPAVTWPPPFYPVGPAAYVDGCPANSSTVRVPALCREDLDQMRALGFDVLRLPLSWSLLEPGPGAIDRRYLDRVAQVVGWARQAGLYVILDMHQNAYSRFIPASTSTLPGGTEPARRDYSGAAAWATYSDGLPFENYLGQREVDPAVFEAATSFWLNRDHLQDHYIEAVAALARRFRDDSTVAGYSIYNEPWPGWAAPPFFDDLWLYPFYRRVIDAITGASDGVPCPAFASALPVCGHPDLGVHDQRHLIFLEPGLWRQIVDLPTHVPVPVSSYPNLVLSIHAYTHKYTVDALLGQAPDRAAYPFGGYDQSYASAELEARAMGAALFVGEFGDEVSEDGLLLTNQLQEQERHRVGAAFWIWKENCSPSAPWGVYAGVGQGQHCAYDEPPSVRDAGPQPSSGCLRADRERLLARVYPEAVAGDRFRYDYDAATGAFELAATAPAGAAETLVVVPPEVRGEASVSGSADLTGMQVDANGGRVLHVRAPGGAYAVVVAAAPLRLTGCA
ncbi:MAG TPA: cellulase family glycosylhydrolase [Terriglobales bacterium]|nr:cellulase family glycosylhydrolase [Terriglobales bacterium]